MNAFTAAPPRPATPEEAERIADLIYVRSGDLDQIAAANAAEARRIAWRDFRRTTGLSTVVAGLLVVTVLQGAFILFRPPQDRIHVNTVLQRDDGTQSAPIAWVDMPRKAREEATVNDLWGYVAERESWWGEAHGRWSWLVVSAMSDDKTREAFQGWFDGTNPTSPAQQYKDGTAVEARYVNWEYACPDCGPQDQNAYRFWFDRYEWERGAKEGKLKGRYSVTVTVKRNVPIPADRIWQKWTFNGSQSQVIGYSQPRREGIAR